MPFQTFAQFTQNNQSIWKLGSLELLIQNMSWDELVASNLGFILDFSEAELNHFGTFDRIFSLNPKVLVMRQRCLSDQPFEVTTYFPFTREFLL